MSDYLNRLVGRSFDPAAGTPIRPRPASRFEPAAVNAFDALPIIAEADSGRDDNPIPALDDGSPILQAKTYRLPDFAKVPGSRAAPAGSTMEAAVEGHDPAIRMTTGLPLPGPAQEGEASRQGAARIEPAQSQPLESALLKPAAPGRIGLTPHTIQPPYDGDHLTPATRTNMASLKIESEPEAEQPSVTPLGAARRSAAQRLRFTEDMPDENERAEARAAEGAPKHPERAAPLSASPDSNFQAAARAAALEAVRALLAAQSSPGLEAPGAPPPETTVQVSIGRIEIRAAPPPTAAPPPKRAANQPPALSLNEYLRRRSQGGGS